jgi:thiol-disulfide isomerase/thioredoxin
MKKILIVVVFILLSMFVLSVFTACVGETYTDGGVETELSSEDFAVDPDSLSEEDSHTIENSLDASDTDSTEPDAAHVESNTVSAEPTGETFYFPFSFSAPELYGTQISEVSLGEKELFFVYFWTTWCPACVRSIPGLARLSEEFGERVGFLSFLGDFGESADNAIRIKQAANAQFYTIDAMNLDLLPLLEFLDSGFVPTSVLIGADGNLIGERIIGSDMDKFRVAIQDALNMG